MKLSKHNFSDASKDVNTQNNSFKWGCQTSQTCSKCGHVSRSNRKGKQFKCVHCGFSLDADLNASRNIAIFSMRDDVRLHVNEPNVAGHEVEGRKAIEAEPGCKPTISFAGS